MFVILLTVVSKTCTSNSSTIRNELVASALHTMGRVGQKEIEIVY
jgi:hypothetical protein